MSCACTKFCGYERRQSQFGIPLEDFGLVRRNKSFRHIAPLMQEGAFCMDHGVEAVFPAF